MPCSHRKLKEYFVPDPNAERAPEWKDYWEEYKERMMKDGHRIVSYSDWTQYVHFLWPGLKLTRCMTDVCDGCIRIEVELKRTDLTEERRNELLREKELHLNAAITQRKFIAQCAQVYAKKYDPVQVFDARMLNAHELDEFESYLNDDELKQIEDSSISPGKVTMQYQDFGGSLTASWFAFREPGANYYASNLNVHPYIIADVSTGVNNVVCYDERVMGKGADAMCSIRLSYHINKLTLSKHVPAVCIDILDNCVGQNKSNATMMLAAMLSVCFL